VILALLLALTFVHARAVLAPGWLMLQARLESLSAASAPDAASISAAFAPEVRAWEPEIVRWAQEYHLAPDLVATVMQIESCGFARAVSRSGALGLFQVMPYHFQGDEDPFDPRTNARSGLRYLAEALHLAEGRIDLALAGYNAGHSAILLQPAAWPEETRRYVYWGSGILNDIAAGHLPSPRLQEWAAAGGARLCAEARSVGAGLP
jgi:soluble lytic murein transglycosylase-like protein